MTQRIVLSGASGLIGDALDRALRERGTEVHRLVRRDPRNAFEHRWNPELAQLDAEVLARADAVISLNGANVGHLPWTKSYRERLRSSRLQSTRTLANALRDLGERAPGTWLSGSAVGFYGNRPGEALDEESSAGDTFLARLCVEWEAEARAVSDALRVVLLRTAPVIHPEGVLRPMIALTKLGLAGPLGHGTQMWPWISLIDEVRGILHSLDRGLVGPVNLTGPTPASANDIGRELAAQMHRPFLIPAPKFALDLALSRDATESLLTADAAVRPEALLGSGFEFQHATPAEAIRAARE